MLVCQKVACIVNAIHCKFLHVAVGTTILRSFNRHSLAIFQVQTHRTEKRSTQPRGGEVKFRFADGELKGCILVSTEELYRIFDYKTDYYIVINDPALEGKYKAEYETKTLFYNSPELRDKNLYVCLPKKTNQIGAAKVVKK